MRVRVEAPARLHLGMIDPHGGLGRRFGSIGVAIERPRLVLEASPAAALAAEGVEAERLAAAARRFSEHYGVEGKVRLRLVETIPAHVGLGSGTHLALAVAASLARFYGLELDYCELARVMGRGQRSGVGIGAFQHGGLIVDGGSGTEATWENTPPILFTRPLPQDWIFVVAIPATDKGLSGRQEDRAFAELPPLAAETAGQICHLLLMQMLPALCEEDVVRFGQALTRIERLVGDSFAPVQLGTFTNELSARLVAHMLDKGAFGAGQSSWGPTVYGLVQGDEQAHALVQELKRLLGRESGALIFHTPARNQGAQVSVSEK
jgi:beta-ribofuranosylaminobenzene 5'-phosphate synthase